jgi:predicted nucleic-acid-binding Zn-ribbon protein
MTTPDSTQLKGDFQMTLICPKCNSEQIDTKNIAKKAGSTLGTVAGAVSVAAGVIRGAKVGASAGTLVGPVGAVLGSITGAILGGLVGGATGGAIGARLGEVVDTNILKNFECLDCGYQFHQSTSDPVSSVPMIP